MQTACLRHMGKKLLVALTMEGKFAGEGLQTLDEDDDMLSAMARELVERNGIGETADAVWKALNTEHRKLFPRNAGSKSGISATNSPDTRLHDQFNPACMVESVLNDTSIIAFGQGPESLAGRRGRRKRPVQEQIPLFSST